MMQTALWVPPCLCGCQLRITGDFDEVTGGISYRHPAPYTVTGLEIVQTCADHGTLPAYDDSGFMEQDEDGNPVQRRGYLRYPIASPTDAEKLYTHLYRYVGNNGSYDTCGCKIYHHFVRDSQDEPVHAKHPLHSKCCKKHHGDDGNAARRDVRVKNQLLGYVQENFPGGQSKALQTVDVPLTSGAMTVDAPADHPVTDCPLCLPYGVAGNLTFNDDNSFSLNAPGLADEDKQAVQAWANATFGAGKVAVG